MKEKQEKKTYVATVVSGAFGRHLRGTDPDEVNRRAREYFRKGWDVQSWAKERRP